MEPYYYQRLSKPMQEAYHAIKRGVESLNQAFPVPRLEMERLSEVLFYLRLDRPEIFYITNFSCRVHPDALRVEFCPEYLFDKGRIREHQKALRARVERLARPAQAFTEWEKERYIHDFICTQVRYDKLKKPYSHEIIGPLGQGVGVCEGIAKSVKALCDQLGLWCIVVISENAPEKGIKYRHAWNVVRIGGRYYHLDATFDNSVGTPELIRYDYFNLEDRRIFRDHEPLITPAPACSEGDGFYYRKKTLLYQAGRGGAPGGTGCPEEEGAGIPLERRLSYPSSVEGYPSMPGAGRSEPGYAPQSAAQLASGSAPGGLYAGMPCAYAGCPAGQRRRGAGGTSAPGGNCRGHIAITRLF